MNEIDDEIGRGAKCEDCGNQAKKGCEFMRCRTCCNGKGFRCQIHIKSTLIHASKKRHLLQQNPQIHTQINPSSGLLEVNELPASVKSTAMFRCVRVQSKDDAVDEYAYQTTVNIGGRVFSGVLHDQGLQSQSQSQSQSFYGSQSFKGGDSSTTMAPLSSPNSHPSSSSSPYPLSFTAFRPGMLPYFHTQD